eukprot:TRINITY_DN1845_c0_g1_i1.p1 TRINITY_DN1845_c0_g1~~TRINITY_DN1845_c0_g1_i1.p1  ORF type:complete len:248 (-),score=52.83 TRINITY_DN1845_c0_g1_i1:116-817(-)
MQNSAKLLFAVLAMMIALSNGQAYIGYWWWTWSSGGSPPPGTNIGIAFSGWINPQTAISQSNAIKDRLPGAKFISLGGGNANGAWTASAIQNINSAINRGEFAGYTGIAYDIEEGDSGLGTLFQESFRTAKAKGLQVLVTVSHSAPYGINDAFDLMQIFFADGNIDYLSPQLYTSGNEGANDYTTSHGVTWNQYSRSRAKIIPSIVRGSLYQSAESYFRSQGVTIVGYVQWAQ